MSARSRSLWVVFLCLFFSLPALADTSILVWPIDPVIEHDQSGSMLWLENKGSSPARLQIRVLGWDQQSGTDQLSRQSTIVASPPAAEVAPGQRQLVRLVRVEPAEAGQERAFRVLVDEIPEASEASNKTGHEQGLGLRFLMRYSIPLFVTGEGLWTRQNHRNPRDMSLAEQPQLRFRVVQKDQRRWLVVRNSGRVHARLSTVTYAVGERALWQNPGLLGYVLVGAEMRWPVPVDFPSTGLLTAIINGNDIALPIPPSAD